MWQFKIMFGWHLTKDMCDINILSFHVESFVVWIEIVGVTFHWEKIT